MEVTFGSVCSGIEAASVAWEVLGWRAVWLAEIDKGASLVLAHRFPQVPNLGDMTRIAARVRRREVAAPDVLVGGTPCQSYSVAGRRQGLADPRGALTIAFIDLVEAIDEVRAAEGKPPVVVVWENVPGVLSSKDNAFGCFLAGLAGEDVPLEPPGGKWANAGAVAGPQRAIAWRVLDAQYFGLAQRRRRVFVVASAHQGIDPVEVLLEFEGVRRDSPPRRAAGEDVTHAVAPCLTSSGRGVERTGDPRGQDAVVAVAAGGVPRDESGGRAGADGGAGGHGGGGPDRVVWPAEIASTLNAHFGDKQGLEDQHVNQGCPLFVPVQVDPELWSIMPMNSGKDFKARRVDVAQPLMAAGPVGGNQGGDYILQPPIAFHPTQDPIFDETGLCHAIGTDSRQGCATAAVAYAIQERATCLNPEAGPDGVGVRDDDAAYTLEARTVPQAVAYSVALRGREGGGTIELGDDVAHCLRASTGGGDKPHVLADIDVLPFDTTQVSSPYNYSQPAFGDPCHPLAAGAHPPAVCITGDITHALKADGFDGSEDGTGRGQPIVPYCETPWDAQEKRIHDVRRGVAPTLAARCNGGGTVDGWFVEPPSMAVRRLMPEECEILQGFPVGWTLVPDARGKPAADGPRYKQCGNSMATKVMRWIGRRLDAQLARIVTLVDDAWLGIPDDDDLLGLPAPVDDLLGLPAPVEDLIG